MLLRDINPPPFDALSFAQRFDWLTVLSKVEGDPELVEGQSTLSKIWSSVLRFYRSLITDHQVPL